MCTWAQDILTLVTGRDWARAGLEGRDLDPLGGEPDPKASDFVRGPSKYQALDLTQSLILEAWRFVQN